MPKTAKVFINIYWPNFMVIVINLQWKCRIISYNQAVIEVLIQICKQKSEKAIAKKKRHLKRTEANWNLFWVKIVKFMTNRF